MICTPPPPKAFCTPANYIYFDLIVSYLIILTTKFVKLPTLWSQISPCRPRKQILLNFFLGLSGRCHHAPAKASSSTPPPYIYPPPNDNMKIRLCTAYIYTDIVMLVTAYIYASHCLAIDKSEQSANSRLDLIAWFPYDCKDWVTIFLISWNTTFYNWKYAEWL
jgi:hypothetical protein